MPVVIDLTGPSGPPVQALLNSFTGRRTVPNVFVGAYSCDHVSGVELQKAQCAYVLPSACKYSNA